MVRVITFQNYRNSLTLSPQDHPNISSLRPLWNGLRSTRCLTGSQRTSLHLTASQRTRSSLKISSPDVTKVGRSFQGILKYKSNCLCNVKYYILENPLELKNKSDRAFSKIATWPLCFLISVSYFSLIFFVAAMKLTGKELF